MTPEERKKWFEERKAKRAAAIAEFKKGPVGSERQKALEEQLREQFLAAWQLAGGPELNEEYFFNPDRRWRFDFAHPESRVAVELEGGVYSQGRHTRGQGFEEDCEKYNCATTMGWRVFRLSSRLIRKDQVEMIALMAAKERKDNTP